MLADIMQIIMLETTEATRVKMYEDYDYLGIAHAVGLATVSFTVLRSFKHRFFLLRIKKLAEFVCQTENFSNFILGEHSGKGLYIILLATQIYNFFRYSPNFQRVNFSVKLIFLYRTHVIYVRPISFVYEHNHYVYGNLLLFH